MKARILDAIYLAADEINDLRPGDPLIVKAPETRLFGKGADLDSLMLVSLIVEVEREVEDAFDVALTLADDRAMSQERSPFRSVTTLADYVAVLLTEAGVG
jgi:acyl carrier protein